MILDVAKVSVTSRGSGSGSASSVTTMTRCAAGAAARRGRLPCGNPSSRSQVSFLSAPPDRATSHVSGVSSSPATSRFQALLEGRGRERMFPYRFLAELCLLFILRLRSYHGLPLVTHRNESEIAPQNSVCAGYALIRGRKRKSKSAHAGDSRRG